MIISSIDKIDLIMLSDFNPSAGGMETWAHGFIPELIKNNPELKLKIYGQTPPGLTHHGEKLVNSVPAQSRENIKYNFFEVKWSKIPWFFSTFSQLWSYFDKHNPKPAPVVLGVGGLFEILCILYSGQYENSKKIIWLRTIFSNEKARKIPPPLKRLFRYFEQHQLRKMDLVLANGDDIAEYYQDKNLRVTVIKNGVDLNKWELSEPLRKDRVTVAFIGRLAKAKGIEEFLQLVSKLKNSSQANNFDFVVAGTGPYEESVLKQQEIGFLKYYGNIENEIMPEFLQNIDVCVALTLSSPEGGGGGTSNALLEQMSAGRVILSWDNAIFSQLLDADNSYLAKQGDIGKLAEHLIQIHDEKNEARRKANCGKDLMQEFSNSKQIHKFERTIEEVLLG